jgi:hypothetical protein
MDTAARLRFANRAICSAIRQPLVGAVMADLATTGTSTRLGDMARFRLSRLVSPRAKL